MWIIIRFNKNNFSMMIEDLKKKNRPRYQFLYSKNTTSIYKKK